MPTFETSLAFLLTVVVLVIVPGPNVLFIMSQGFSGGRSAATKAAFGVELGTMVHVFAASLGLSAILAKSAAAYELLRWAGTAYLVVLAVQQFRSARAEGQAEAAAVTASPNPLLRGMIVNVLNPKVAIFFLAFFPQFLDKNKPMWSQALTFEAILFVVSVTFGLAYGLGASAMGGRVRNLRTTKLASGVAYLVLAAISVVMGRRPTTS